LQRIYNTVDGRNPAPAGDVENPVNAGINYLLTGANGFFFHQQ